MRRRRNKAIAACQASFGWTLIEVLVALVIVVLLAMLSYPSYQQIVIRARRAEAKSALLQLMQQQERFHAQRNTYVEFSADAASADAQRFKWFIGSKHQDSAYQIEGIACPGESVDACILLRATPGGPRVNRSFSDAECGRLGLTSTGVKTAEGDLARCW
ncbi:type IV pilus assembly protein PilE [Noviherbaspirillum humi]|uniref:Type IV pilus assembly protein PilE n=1 Tax=Noviherbaspirillum humi TaxID=1688639 RepID=A0A239DJ38_9BURK|nr:type IV pilin protein [Noviherbaspirillum humi]SNS32021.1 type IV pilus assembly protein PilE [Noviherbaspirillum humi]